MYIFSDKSENTKTHHELGALLHSKIPARRGQSTPAIPSHLSTPRLSSIWPGTDESPRRNSRRKRRRILEINTLIIYIVEKARV